MLKINLPRFIAIFCSLFVPQALFALGEATDLQLAGGKITALAEGGDYVFAATRGPRGIYASSDFGTTWNFASGGDYSTGSGKAVVTTATHVFAILGKKLYGAALNTLSNSDFNPDWQEIDLSLATTLDLPEVPEALAVDTSFLFVSTTYANVKVVTLSSLTLASTSNITSVTSPVPVPKLATDRSAEFVFALIGAANKPSGKIMRAPYDTSSGSISSWSDKSPGNPGAGCGAEGVGGGAGTVNSGRFGGVFTAGSSVVYVTTFNGTSNGKGIYRSTDDGDCWRRVVSSGERSTSLNIRSASFQGDTHMVGRFVSTNGSANNATISFEEVLNDAVPLDAGLDSVAVLVGSSDDVCDASPGDVCAMASSPFGAVITTDLEPGGSSSWSERLSGMRGLLAADIDQSLSDPSIAVLALPGGIARSTNFDLSSDSISAKSVSYSRFVPQDGGTSLPEPVFTVKIDPDDANTVYVGNNRLLRAVFDSNGEPAWTVINTVIAQGKVVRDIFVTETKIYAVFAQVTSGLGGELRVFNRSTLESELTEGLLGKPISTLAVATSGSTDVIYAGIGGVRTLETDGTSEDNLGLFRSTDGGSNFTKVEGSDFFESAAISALAYDAANDILYVGANEAGLSDEFEDGGGNDSENSEEEGEGKLFIIKKASKSGFDVDTPSKGFPSGEPIRALAVAEKDGSQDVYAAVGSKLYKSSSKGNTWALLFEGLSDQAIKTLLFDDLVASSTSGLESISDDPRLIVSSVTGNVKAGTRGKIKVVFSKEFQDTSNNKAKLTAKVGTIRGLISKRNDLTLTIKPRGGASWPSSSSRVKLKVKAGFIADDGEGLDSDYDETIDGNAYTKNVKIKS